MTIVRSHSQSQYVSLAKTPLQISASCTSIICNKDNRDSDNEQQYTIASEVDQ
jgi:hypothetical protein